MKISVVIPVYNCEDFIAQTLDGIYTQSMSRKDIEIIIYLDAPTDNTELVVQNWVKNHVDISVQVIRGTVNRGVAYARNIALGRVRGRFVHFMDSDDLINVDFYQEMYNAAIRTGADVAVASYWHQRRPNSSIIFDNAIVVSQPQDKIDLTRVDRHGMMWRYLIRRDFWKKNKFSFPEDMKICEDWVLANKMVFASNYVVLVPSAKYFYRCRENSLMSITSKKREGSPEANRANREMQLFLKENGLQRCAIPVSVFELRLFGKIILFSVAAFDNKREYRLFGKILLGRSVCVGKITRNWRR